MKWKEASQLKVIQPESLEDWRAQLQRAGKKLVTINGTFDLLHAGHLHILYEASKQGDFLLVCLNSDHSVKLYKDKDLPIIPLNERLEMMTALEFVDFATWFDEPDPCKLLSIIRPDIHVNGAEYGMDCIEAPIVNAFGKLHLVERIPGLASSEIIKKIKVPCV